MEFTCPKCKSKAYKRNGYTRHGKQNHRCLDCGRQFSLELPVIDEQNHSNQQVVYRLLCEVSSNLESENQSHELSKS